MVRFFALICITGYDQRRDRDARSRELLSDDDEILVELHKI